MAKQMRKINRRKEKPKGPIVQGHHITYDPERIVYVTKGEHKILTLMQWYCKKRVGKGFLTALRQFIKDNRLRAVDMRKEK